MECIHGEVTSLNSGKHDVIFETAGDREIVTY